MIVNKTRSFNAKWYQQYEWIEYSIAKDTLFCYLCHLFSHANNKAEHSCGKGGAFAKRNTSKSHQEALMNWNQFKMTVATGSLVG